jgi:hypothetical protein
MHWLAEIKGEALQLYEQLGQSFPDASAAQKVNAGLGATGK